MSNVAVKNHAGIMFAGRWRQNCYKGVPPILPGSGANIVAESFERTSGAGIAFYGKR